MIIFRKVYIYMNRTIFFISMAGAMAGVASQDVPVQQLDAATVEQMTMASVQQARPRHQIGFNLYGGISTNGESELYDTNMFGIELEYGYYFTKNQAVTLGMSFAGGGDNVVQYLPGKHGPRYFEYDYNRSSFSLMLGYRVQIPLTQRLFFTAGVKGGMDVQGLSLEYYPKTWHYDPYDDEYYTDADQSDYKVGLKYAAHAGLNFKLTEKTRVELGYQFSASTARPEVCHEWERGCPSVKAPEYGLHEIHVGLRFDF